MSSLTGEAASNLFIKYHDIISIESDRGAVIVSGSILDAALEKLILSYLLPPVSNKKQDKLVNGAYAPLGSFSAKIEMSYRLGLIRGSVLEQLQLFKKIRNDFAHRLEESALESNDNKIRIQNIFDKTPEIENAVCEIVSHEFKKQGLNTGKGKLVEMIGARDAFNMIFAGVCMSLERVSLDIERIKPQV